jgi:hypothetical protein
MHLTMTDAGEALVDAEARIQERLDEREAERRRRGGPAVVPDPEKLRQIESLKLARIELERQAVATASEVRKQQIALALEEIGRRLAESGAG